MLMKQQYNVKLIVFLVGLTVLFCDKMSAQESVYERPIYFNQYFNDPQVNAIPLKREDRAVFTLSHRRNSNDFGGVNTSVFSGLFKLGKDDSKFGVLGLQMLNDREGSLIQRNRVLPSYTQHLRVSSKFNMAGGIGLGFYNFLISGDGTFEGASDFGLDVSFLVKLYGEHSNIQFSVNQATNSKIVPVQQEIVLGRSFNLFMNRIFKVNNFLSIVPSAYGRYSKEQDLPLSGLVFGGGTHLLFDNQVLAGMSYEYEGGYNFFAGLNGMSGKNSNLSFELSYFVPSNNSGRTNVQMFELMLKYLLGNKKK